MAKMAARERAQRGVTLDELSTSEVRKPSHYGAEAFLWSRLSCEITPARAGKNLRMIASQSVEGLPELGRDQKKPLWAARSPASPGTSA